MKYVRIAESLKQNWIIYVQHVWLLFRWISYLSNRKLSLLKVQYVKTPLLYIWPSVTGTAAYGLFLLHAALVGFESNNKYEVRNSMGQNVFYAVEENDCLSRQCCGPMRSFTIHVLDNFGQEIITVTRPLKCMSCFFPCCLQEVSSAETHTSSYACFYWFTLKSHCSPTIPHSAGGAGSPWEHSGVR